MRFADLSKDQQEKLTGDVFCIRCQKSFRLVTFEERQFRGQLMIEGRCPQCDNVVVKPAGAAASP